MRIYIKNTNLEAFWNHFSPMGLISLYGSIGHCGGQIYLVDLRRWDREYTEAEEKAIWEEVMMWAVHCPI